MADETIINYACVMLVGRRSHLQWLDSEVPTDNHNRALRIERSRGIYQAGDLGVWLQRRDNIPTIPEPGKLALPGGAEEPEDEGDMMRTAQRELREETGYRASMDPKDNLKALTLLASPDEFTDSLGRRIRRYVYIVRHDGFQKVELQNEGTEMNLWLLKDYEEWKGELARDHGHFIDIGIELYGLRLGLEGGGEYDPEIRSALR